MMTPEEARRRAVRAAANSIFRQRCAERMASSRDMAEAAIAAYEAALWQPIETAPRDGTRALFFAPPAGVEWPASLLRIDLWRRGGWWQMRPAQPYTHWRPLPAEPGDGA